MRPTTITSRHSFRLTTSVGAGQLGHISIGTWSRQSWKTRTRILSTSSGIKGTAGVSPFRGINLRSSLTTMRAPVFHTTLVITSIQTLLVVSTLRTLYPQHCISRILTMPPRGISHVGCRSWISVSSLTTPGTCRVRLC